MSYMKQFAKQMAHDVYQLKKTDKEIILSIKSDHPEVSEEWIKSQIQCVRDNPKLFKGIH